ncbi:hypothetical protein, partial [Streptococcus pluranimalium]|uniref:hypothetical protein n=1 Tax=Streptococcus pluranimalium TaxID=82348 RepID=UPI004046D819
MKKKHILYGTAAVLASATLGTATVSADTFIINVDGVQTQVAEYDNGLSAETLAAIEASLIDNNLANGLRYDSADFSTPGTRIYNFTSPTAETPAEAEKPAEVVPAAEKLEDYKLIVTVDGQEVQASDFSLIAYSELEEHQSALVEAKLAEGLTFDAIDRVGNAFTLSFSTPAEVPAVNSEWVPNDYVNSNKEVAENFKIVVEVDGKEVQVSDFEAITYSDFVNHLAALTEAKLAEGLAYDGNAQ